MATPLALVLVELVQNAVEHGLDGRDGEVTVEVQVAAGPGPGDRLTVAVADDGAGLPADFDPVDGGGLGLQIVRTLVEGELGGDAAGGPRGPRHPGRAGPAAAAAARLSRRTGRTTGPRRCRRGPVVRSVGTTRCGRGCERSGA